MKRTLSFVLCFCLIFSMFGTALVGTAGAVTYNDLAANHWANDEIQYMSEKGILQGNLGNFRPEDKMTKAEFIKVINYTFGLQQTKTASYADVSMSKWYYSDIMKAAYHGYLTTDGSYVYPDSQLTREEACALVARYLGLTASSNYSRFTDSSSISYAYMSYVNACAENGIVGGYTNGEFRPKNTLTRAEASAIIYRLAGTIYKTSTYGTDAGANYTNAVINTTGVTVSNANLTGTVYVSEGTEYGIVTLQNCTINGTLKVVGAATVNLVNTTVAKLVVDTTSGNAATINVSGTSIVNSTEVNSAAKLANNTTADAYGFRTITVAMPAYSTVTFDGAFQSVAVANPYNYIALADEDTEIAYLTIAKEAANVKLTGNGKIAEAIINAAGANFSIVPEKFNIANGLSAIFAGVKYTGTGAATTYPKYYLVDGSLEIRDLRTTPGTLYYMIVPNNSTAPTAQQVINGTSYNSVSVVDAGSMYLSAGYENVDTSALLTNATNYDLYVYFQASNAAVTGSPEKIDLYTATAPSFAASYPSYGTLSYVSTNNYTMPIKVKATSSCTAYAIAVPKGSVAPSASQIYETAVGSTSYNANVTVSSRAVVNVSSNTETTINLTGLANSSYDYYVVLANASTSPVSIRSTNTTTSSVDTGFAAGYPVVTSIRDGLVTVAFKTSAAGTVYVLPYNSASTAPAAAQIMSTGTPVAMTTLSSDGYYYATATVYAYGADKVAAIFVPNNGVAKTPVYGALLNGTVLTVPTATATTTGFRAGYPQITFLDPVKNQLTLVARTNEAGRVYVKGYSSIVPTAAEIYQTGSSFGVSYDAALGCYTGSVNANYSNPNIAALFVPATGTYATYLPVYGTIGTVKGTILLPTTAPTTNVPVVSITSAVSANNAPIYVTYSEKMYWNNAALSAQTDPGYLKALFPITASDGSTVDYTVAVSDNTVSPYNTVVTITPATGWADGVTYTVTPNTNIKNASGNIPVVKSGSFKVNVTRPSAVLAPTASVPTSEAVLTLTFTQAMALKTVDGAMADLTNANVGSYVTVYKKGDSTNPVSATAKISEDKKIITITVAEKLEANTEYDVKLSESVTNAAGTAPATTTYSFTTASKTAVASPVIVVKSGDDVIVDNTLKAGTYTVAITYDETASKVYYTLDGTTPEDGSDEYTGEQTITIAPNQTIKIRAIAKVNTGSDLASSPEVTRILTGEAVTVNASPETGSAADSNTEVALTTSYGTYDIKYIKSATKITENAAETAAAGSTYTAPIKDVAGKYLYAVAVDSSNTILGEVSEFFYPVLEYPVVETSDIITLDSKSGLIGGYVSTGDVIEIGYVDEQPKYDYELIVTIKIDGEPIVASGITFDEANIGKKGLTYTVKDAENAKIEVSAKIVATGSNAEITDSEVYFANPMPVINLTMGPVDKAKTEAVSGEYNIDYNTRVVVDLVKPSNLPAGFAWTWGTRTINGTPISDGEKLTISALQQDLEIVAKATAGGKAYEDNAKVLVQPVAPKLIDTEGNDLPSVIDYVAGNSIAVKLLNGKNYSNVVSYDCDGGITAELTTASINPFDDWAYIKNDGEPSNTLTVTFTAKYDDGTEEGRVATSTYILKNPSDSTALPLISVKVNDKVVKGDLVEVTVGDVISATTTIYGGTVKMQLTEVADGATTADVSNPYTIAAADSGKKLELTAQIVENASSPVSQYVVVIPKAPVISQISDSRVNITYSDADGVFHGMEYTVINSKGETATFDEAYADTVAGTNTHFYALTDDFSDGYTVKAKAYTLVNEKKFYGEEATLTREAAPVITEYEYAATAYDVYKGQTLTLTAAEGVKIYYKLGAAAVEYTEPVKLDTAGDITITIYGEKDGVKTAEKTQSFKVLETPAAPEFYMHSAEQLHVRYPIAKGEFSGIEYTVVNSKGETTTVEKTYAEAQTGTAYKYYVVYNDFSDAYTVTAKAFVTIDGNRIYGDEATLTRAAAPTINDFAYSATAYNVGKGQTITLAAAEDVKIFYKLGAADAVEYTGAIELNTVGNTTIKIYGEKDGVKTAEKTQVFNVLNGITFTPASKDVAKTGGDKINVAFPSVTGLGDVKYTVNGKEVTVAADNYEVTVPAYTDEAKFTVEAKLEFVDADGNAITAIEASAEYTYAEAPEFAVYAVTDTKQENNLVKTSADGTYVEVEKDTVVQILIKNAKTGTKFAINSASLNTIYTEDSLAGGLISNIAETGEKGIKVSSDKYVNAQFTGSPVAKLMLKVKGEEAVAPDAPVLYLDSAKATAIDAAKEVLVAGKINVYKNTSAAGTTFAKVNNGAATDWSAAPSITVELAQGHFVDNVCKIEMWNKNAEGLESAHVTYTFKNVTDNSLLNVPKIDKAVGEVKVGDVLSATSTQQGVSVMTKTNYVGAATNSFVDGGYTVLTADQGKALVFEAKSVLKVFGTTPLFESAAVTATYFVAPKSVEAANFTVDGTKITVNAPNKGAATGVAYSVNGGAKQELPFGDKTSVEIKLNKGDSAKIWYYYATGDAKVGTLYSATPATIAEAPVIDEVIIYKEENALTTGNKSVLIAGSEISVKTSTGTRIIYNFNTAANAQDPKIKSATADVVDGVAKLDKISGVYTDGETYILSLRAMDDANNYGDLVQVEVKFANAPKFTFVTVDGASKASGSSDVYTDGSVISAMVNKAGTLYVTFDGNTASAEVDGVNPVTLAPLTFSGSKELKFVPEITVDGKIVTGEEFTITLEKLDTPTITNVKIGGRSYGAAATVNAYYVEGDTIEIETNGGTVYAVLDTVAPHESGAYVTKWTTTSKAFAATATADGNELGTYIMTYAGTYPLSIETSATAGGKTVYSNNVQLNLTYAALPTVTVGTDNNKSVNDTFTVANGYAQIMAYGNDVAVLPGKATVAEGTYKLSDVLVIGASANEITVKVLPKTTVDGTNYEGEAKTLTAYANPIVVNGKNYGSLSEALAESSVGDNLFLGSDVVLTENVTIPAGVKLTVPTAYTLTVKNAKITLNGTVWIAARGNVKTEGTGSIVVAPSAKVYYDEAEVKTLIFNDPAAFITLNNGTVELSSTAVGGTKIVVNGEITINKNFAVQARDELVLNNSIVTVAAGAHLFNNGTASATNSRILYTDANSVHNFDTISGVTIASITSVTP